MKLQAVGLLLIAASTFAITACGQKGPLYKPQKQAPAEQAAPAEGAGAAEEQADKDTEKDKTDTTGK